MKRFIALALLFTSFSSLTSCGPNYKVNEQEFWDAISMKNVKYLQCSFEDKDGGPQKMEMSPNIFHNISVYEEYAECYIKYNGGPMDEDKSYYELIRSNPEDPFIKGGYPASEYNYPEKFGQILTGMLEEQSITYQHFNFQNNTYQFSSVTLQFRNKKLVSIDTGDYLDFDKMILDYKRIDIKMPKPGDKL